MPTKYSFITHWQIKAPLAEVWDAIYHSLEWPQWWKGVVAVNEIEKGDENGVGGVREYTWKSVLPYTLCFNMRLTELEKYKWLKGEAFGELEGVGEWFFREENGTTYLQYNWTVFTNKPWMNYLSFILKPAFNYNHNVVMHWGAEGLARRLSVEPISDK
jgi:uncharacterized protein YndB with AHSA1/START domain